MRGMTITEETVYVKIKNVAKRHKQLKRIWSSLLKKEFKRFWKELLTGLKPSDTLSELLDCDTEKQIVTTKVVKENGLWKLNRIYISTFK